MPETVIISGATGYIAQHTVKAFLDHGYAVVGTVRSEAKGAKLVRLLNNPRFSYVVVSDIQIDGAFDDVLKKHPQATGFIHTASPFFYDTEEPEKDLLYPAINGTKNVLKSITRYGVRIRRVVVTSSYAAMYTHADETNPNFVRDESSWNPINWDLAASHGALAYVGSKVFAEKAAWEFLHLEKPEFSLVTVNPSFVFGPQLFDEDVRGTLNTSAEIINTLLKLNPSDQVPKEAGSWVDVRDVARAHVVAYAQEEASGKRLLLVAGRFTGQGILDIIREKIPQLQSKLPVGKPGGMEKFLKRFCQINDKQTRRLLGYEYLSLEQSALDTVRQIVEVNK